MIEKALLDLLISGRAIARGAESTLADMEAREWDIVDRLNNNSTSHYDIYSYYNDSQIKTRTLENTKMPQDLQDEINMTYNEYVDYLIVKYGTATCDFYYNYHCETENRSIHRLSTDGLFLHHIAEECMVDFNTLTSKEYAKSRPFELQKAQNFIYCDYLEHLLLHMKIAKEDWMSGTHSYGVDVNGARLIWRELNWYFALGRSYLPKRKAIELVKDRYNDYILIMQYFHSFVTSCEMREFCPEDDLAEDVNGLFSQQLFTDIRNY